MEDEVFETLAQIHEGGSLGADASARWVQALRAISWIVETESGLMLTTAGQDALAQFKSERRDL